jgi:hypothetical protein
MKGTGKNERHLQITQGIRVSFLLLHGSLGALFIYNCIIYEDKNAP